MPVVSIGNGGTAFFMFCQIDKLTDMKTLFPFCIAILLLLASCDDKYASIAEEKAFEATVCYFTDYEFVDYCEAFSQKANTQVVQMIKDYENRRRKSYDGILPYDIAKQITSEMFIGLGIDPEYELSTWHAISSKNIKNFIDRLKTQYTHSSYSLQDPRFHTPSDTNTKNILDHLLTNIENPHIISSASLDTLAGSCINNLYNKVANNLKAVSVEKYHRFKLPDTNYPVSKKDIRKYYVVYFHYYGEEIVTCRVTVTKDNHFYTQVE